MKTRRNSALSLFAAAAVLVAGAVSAQEQRIDIRVTPEVRLRQAARTSTATRPALTSAQRDVASGQHQIVAVHYPTVVLGTVNYLEAAPQPQVIVAGNDGFYSNGVFVGDNIPMFWGGASDAALFGFEGAEVDVASGTIRGVNRPAGLTVTGQGATVFSGRVRSPFVGVAGPGFGFGVAGPAALPGQAGLRANTGTIRTDQAVIVRNARTAGGDVTGGVTGGAAVGNATIGGASAGPSGNVVVGVGGGAVSGGRR
jgi:hypothetical protein